MSKTVRKESRREPNATSASQAMDRLFGDEKDSHLNPMERPVPSRYGTAARPPKGDEETETEHLIERAADRNNG